MALLLYTCALLLILGFAILARVRANPQEITRRSGCGRKIDEPQRWRVMG